MFSLRMLSTWLYLTTGIGHEIDSV